MKKVFPVILIVLVLSLYFPFTTFAAAVHIECEEFELFKGEQFGGANIQENELGFTVVGSKPEEIGIECYTSFNVDILEAGKYTFKIQYAAEGDGSAYNRKGDLVLNEARFNIPLSPTGDWVTFNNAVVTADLEAGPLKIMITSPADYDNSTVKTCNYDWIEYELTELKVIEPEVISAEAPNPDTADISVFYSVLALFSAFGGIITFRKK
ncbi:MAG: hypothetical protein K0S55_451 [Clostridia bacterium]|jgi:hypothetical protein|nr:hypothetical protein [Clostridia bacterium]